MSTVQLRIDLPPNLSSAEARLLLAIKLYEVGRLTLGQAAKLAEISKRAFIEMLGQYHVPVFNYSSEELEQEISL